MSSFFTGLSGLYRSTRGLFLAVLIVFVFISSSSDTSTISTRFAADLPIAQARAENGFFGELPEDPGTAREDDAESPTDSEYTTEESPEENPEENSEEYKNELAKKVEKNDDNKNVGHSKDTVVLVVPSPTALPTTTIAENSEKGTELDQKTKKIKNPKDNAEALEHVAPDAKRKLEEAIAAAERAGKTVDLVSNGRYSPEMEEEYSKLESTIKQGILNGSMNEAQGLQTLAQARLAGRIYTAGGEKLNGIVPDGWNPGNPSARTGTTTAGFQLQDAQSRAAATFRNMNQLLTDTRGAQNLGSLSRLSVAQQYSYYFLDHTAVTQGNWGSCWACSAEAMGWAWRPDQMSSAMNQLISTNSFVSPFSNETSQSKNFKSDQLVPSPSNLTFDMNKAGGGEQSYVDKLGQLLIGNLAGNSTPWNGGVPSYANSALFSVAGITTPTQYGVGGVPGLTKGINEGTIRLVQYIPFPGHSASNSGRVLPTTDGGFLGFGINDNSWGQNGEHMFLATPENINMFRFPGGGGSRFGGPGGDNGTANGLISGLLGGMQGQPVSPQAAAAAQAATQQQQRDAYSKLNTNERVTVRSVCVQAVGPKTTSLPHVCRLALTDKTLPSIIDGAAVKSSGSGSSMSLF
jgi:hypothetical protein